MRKLVVLVVMILLVALPTGAAQAKPGLILGDVNADGAANSTDAVIILSADAGLANTRRFCGWMPLGDVNNDQLVNSTDALIILYADAGFLSGTDVGQPVNYFPMLSDIPPACYPW